jgi:hypothetical protein
VTTRLGRRAFLGPVCAGIAVLAALDIASQTAVYMASALTRADAASPAGTGVLAILAQVSPVTGVLALLVLAAVLTDRGVRAVAMAAGVVALLLLGSSASVLMREAMPGGAGTLGDEIGRRLVRQAVGSGLIGAVGLLSAAVLLFRLPRGPHAVTPEGPGILPG